MAVKIINGVVSYPLKSGNAPAVINGVIYNWEEAAAESDLPIPVAMSNYLRQMGA